MNNKIIIVTSGEPGGIGPDICLDIAKFNKLDVTIVVLGDRILFQERAKLLGRSIDFVAVSHDDIINYNLPILDNNSSLLFYDIPCVNRNTVGQVLTENVPYVLQMLDIAIDLCQTKAVRAMITAPINKEVINHFGIRFTGHTEYIATKLSVPKVVMMLANSYMKVALLTTHIPLKDVTKHVTLTNLSDTLNIIITSFRELFKISNPKIAVCGLNPHAGEGGYLGDEEINILNPVINDFRSRGYLVSGAYPADTIFTKVAEFDVILAIYHDQGLPVLKYAEFEHGVNITLGLPIIRVSVDHGTALDLAGTGKASSSSLFSAIKMANELS